MGSPVRSSRALSVRLPSAIVKRTAGAGWAIVAELKTLTSYLDWLEAQYDEMVAGLAYLADINSGSYNIAGLERMAAELSHLFGVLGGQVRRVVLEPIVRIDDDGEPRVCELGPVLRLSKYPDAALRVLLVGHMDTVFGIEHAFQRAERVSPTQLKGPGVADLKGGLLVMLKALECLERSPWAGRLGWEVVLNPDEELGSPGSAAHLRAAAGRNHLGLVYEPAMADGALAAARKGSGNFTAVVRGRAAHAGREHHLGRNAVRAAADFLIAVDELNGRQPGVTVNPGFVHGGGPVNMVPDRAVVRFNIRLSDPADEAWVLGRLAAINQEINARDGITLALHGDFGRKPKVLDAAHRRLFEWVRCCGRTLGLNITWRDTGGCCDGNNLSAAGLPNIDTMGVIGGGLHSVAEYVELPSLIERSRLSALLLLGLASGRCEGVAFRGESS
ncbi:MAG: hydrolase [Nitrococcus mobilis]|nr:hydrolase [Nitrococcus mobilis]